MLLKVWNLTNIWTLGRFRFNKLVWRCLLSGARGRAQWRGLVTRWYRLVIIWRGSPNRPCWRRVNMLAWHGPPIIVHCKHPIMVVHHWNCLHGWRRLAVIDPLYHLQLWLQVTGVLLRASCTRLCRTDICTCRPIFIRFSTRHLTAYAECTTLASTLEFHHRDMLDMGRDAPNLFIFGFNHSQSTPYLLQRNADHKDAFVWKMMRSLVSKQQTFCACGFIVYKPMNNNCLRLQAVQKNMMKTLSSFQDSNHLTSIPSNLSSATQVITSDQKVMNASRGENFSRKYAAGRSYINYK